MSNVIPKNVLKDNWRIRCANFIIVASLVLFLVAAVAALLLAPSYFELVSADKNAAATKADQSSDLITLLGAQALVSAVSPMLATATTTPSSAIASALADKPKGIVISQITYQQGQPDVIILNGTASGRGIINTFQQSLQQDPRFSSVNVPISDLIGTDKNNFSITLSGTF